MVNDHDGEIFETCNTYKNCEKELLPLKSTMWKIIELVKLQTLNRSIYTKVKHSNVLFRIKNYTNFRVNSVLPLSDMTLAIFIAK